MAEPAAAAAAALYAEARARGALLDLGTRARWRLAGADRIRYLNGQVTNDVRHIPPGTAIPACVTTAKGRLCGVIFVSAGPDFLRIDAEGELREPLAQRLERYIIADDAELRDVTGEECHFHLAGAPRPEEISGAEIIAATRLGHPGFDILAPAARREAILAALGHAALIPPALEEALRIEAGIPRWGAELDEETLPAEAGLDAAAIDFHKGCYIGQEVISRIKSVGHVNRRLTGFTASAPLAAGMTLHAESGAEAGRLTSAAWSFGLESWAALGYLKRGSAAATLHARSADGAATEVKIRDLPLVP
ncbi:MAG TPA: glycine cleavage T C-terminal barrel domain-containing protein [Chthoniobacteraceae bacterium]|jgi:folate-binding protein YgfZ|nr:glycine cleavage T C-terminal barrel domain-containing protein [Chthoniobacteraceae bacterium]